MTHKEAIQIMYNKMKNDCDRDSNTILAFLNWLHYEKDEVKLLVDMQGLTIFERQYMEQLLDGKIPKDK